MKSLRFATIAIAALATTASAQTTPTGAWRAVFGGPVAARPKVPTYIQLDVRQTENGLAGTVHADKWPGDGVISDIKIDGSHVTFTTVMENGWWATSSGGTRVDHCCPKFTFDGTIDGDKMTLTLKWSSTEIPDGSGPTYQMEARRVTR
jgi:hypothetical protein